MTAAKLSHPISEALEQHIAAACARVAPTWPLDQFIAVNPYWGWVGQPIEVAASTLGALAGTRLTMPRSWFQAEWAAGLQKHLDLLAACRRDGIDATFAALTAQAEDEGADGDSIEVPFDPALIGNPAAALVSAWLSQLARDLDLDVAVLGTRGDIEAFLRGEPSARLAHGWRNDVAGADIKRLIEGEAALAFDGQTRLVLEDRS